MYRAGFSIIWFSKQCFVFSIVKRNSLNGASLVFFFNMNKSTALHSNMVCVASKNCALLDSFKRAVMPPGGVMDMMGALV